MNPTVTWVTRRRPKTWICSAWPSPGRIVQVLSHAAAPIRGLPSVGRRPRFRHHRDRQTPTQRLRRRTALLPWSLRRPHRHERGPAPAGPPDARDRGDGPGVWLPVSGNTGPVRLPLRFSRSEPEDSAATAADCSAG